MHMTVNGEKKRKSLIFHPREAPDPRFDPGIEFLAQKYIGNRSQFKVLLLKIFVKSDICRTESKLNITQHECSHTVAFLGRKPSTNTVSSPG